MKVRELFAKDIFRPINGVVKADQVDESTVWQELDEFVVTRELNSHIQKFFGSYIEGIDNPKNIDISGKIGVWISGFFGSGKSHFIKILSYVLRNRLHKHEGDSKKAVEFFKEKEIRLHNLGLDAWRPDPNWTCLCDEFHKDALEMLVRS